MSKKVKYVAALLAVGIVVVGAVNYFLVHRSVQQVLESDIRNQGISVFAHYQYFVVPSVLVIDLRKVSDTNSPADVTRVLLQFAQSQKSKAFSLVTLAHQGKPKFTLKGEFFQTLGIEFGEQNPVYTMRTLSGNCVKKSYLMCCAASRTRIRHTSGRTLKLPLSSEWKPG